MNRPLKTYSQWRQEKLSDPERALRYLRAARKESREAFFHAVKNVIQANKVARIAKKVNVSRESIYRSFSAEGNPAFSTLESALKEVGIDFDLKLSDSVKQAAKSEREPRIVVSSKPPVPDAKPVTINISGYMTQGIAGSIVANFYGAISGTSVGNPFEQGKEELWTQKTVLLLSPQPPLMLRRQVTLPTAMPTMFNLSQPSGI